MTPSPVVPNTPPRRGSLRLLRHVYGRLQTPMPLSEQVRYSPFLAQMVVTRACNLRCAYCNEYAVDGRPVPLETLKRQLDKLRELGACAVEFTGGEPLLHPELMALIRYATDLDFPRRMMISNAYLLNEERIAALNDAGLSEMQVSIDGVTPNETTKKVLSAVEPKLKLLAAQARFSVQLNGVIGACPPTELLEVIGAAKRLGFRPRVLVIHDGEGQIKADQDNLFLLNEAKAQMGRRFGESGGYRERLLAGQDAPFKCRAGARYLYVNEHGEVTWCSQMSKTFVKPLLAYTPYDLKHQFHTVKPCTATCTVGCARSCSSPDEWRQQSICKGR